MTKLHVAEGLTVLLVSIVAITAKKSVKSQETAAGELETP